ncbi:hypothetical protein [Azospirillum baldaniorum]|uniref:hypothetical protein n=1 Tax=Azospirillum baldaniorum TaxID=1064539 RepID=UPI0011A2978F|nr:hypothetical protein [Azospirillum baldaniorum]
MAPFITRLPSKGDRNDFIDIDVHEIIQKPFGDRRCGEWHRNVQPVIDSIPNRADAGWDWNLKIPMAAFMGGMVRQPRLFQVTAGPSAHPAAMIAILLNERCFYSAGPAAFLWYLSTAPDPCIKVQTRGGRIDSPGMLGLAALDVALTLSLHSPCNGRMWLHAAPQGGNALLHWYGLSAVANRVPSESYGTLPGAPFMGRRNDERYFAFTTETALWAHARFSTWR